jgi:hypothetical protein
VFGACRREHPELPDLPVTTVFVGVIPTQHSPDGLSRSGRREARNRRGAPAVSALDAME